MKTCDVLVVGAGLAGLTAAHDLARLGLSVILIDRKSSLSAPVHTTGIFVRRTFEERSIPDHLLGPAVRDVVLYSPARRALALTSSRDEFRVGNMGAIYRSLAARCVSSGVRWEPATHFIATAADREVVLLRSERGPSEVRARFVIGADGCASRVARDLQLSANTEWIVGAEEVLEGVPLEGRPRFECYLDPRLAPGYLSWVVHDGEAMHLGVGGYPRKFDPSAALRAFRATLARDWDFSSARVLETRGGRIPVGGVLPRIGCSRGLLVGDAAGAVSPLTAGGLDGAIRLSRLAARVAAQYLETEDAAVLAGYSGDLFRARFWSRRWMRRALRTFESEALLELACAVLRTGPGRILARKVFFGRGSFPEVEFPSLASLRMVGTAERN